MWKRPPRRRRWQKSCLEGLGAQQKTEAGAKPSLLGRPASFSAFLLGLGAKEKEEQQAKVRYTMNLPKCEGVSVLPFLYLKSFFSCQVGFIGSRTSITSPRPSSSGSRAR